jgi:enamine deaminase RidA (YjgF/YER057c/UK114 family)
MNGWRADRPRCEEEAMLTRRWLGVALLGACALPCTELTAQGARTERINPPGLMKPTGYTHVVTVQGGKLVFVAGQVALDKEGNVVGKGDLKAQAQQVFENLKTALAAAGASPRDVVKAVTYVVNYSPSQLPVLREARQAFFGGAEPPASTLVGVQALAREDFLIEIEVFAVVP